MPGSLLHTKLECCFVCVPPLAVFFLCPPPLSFSSRIPLLLVILLFCLICFSVLLWSMSSFPCFFSCIHLVSTQLVILLFIALSLSIFSGSFLSFGFYCFSHSTLFLPSISLGGGLSKGVPQRHFGMPAEPLSLAPRPHPEQSFKGAMKKKRNPAISQENQTKPEPINEISNHMLSMGKQQLTPPKPQTRPKSTRISAPTTTLGLQQSLKGETPPSSQ